MRTALTLLDDIRIASPCPARWEDMTGDEHARHCCSCDRTVYDLSSLTADEAVSLIHEKEGALCVRLYRRADGRVLTADCPEGLRGLARDDWRIKWIPALLGGGLLQWLLVFLFMSQPSPTTCVMGAFPGDVELLPAPDVEVADDARVGMNGQEDVELLPAPEVEE
jgi:hypothetical protein